MLDAIIARLSSVPSWNVYSISPQDGSTAPWYEVTGTTIMSDLVIRESDLLEQIQTVSARIAHWGRLAAQAKRVWQIADREYRTWRDRTVLALIEATEKKPTEKVIEATYRTMPEYAVLYRAIERAEEAYNACLATLDGFKAKKEALKTAVYRRNEDGAAILSI